MCRQRGPGRAGPGPSAFSSRYRVCAKAAKHEKPSISRVNCLPFLGHEKWRAVQDASKEAAEYIPRATGWFCDDTLYQSGRSFHGVCLGEHTHCSVAIALEGGEATVEPGVDVLVRGLFNLKLTRYIRETGEQLLF